MLKINEQVPDFQAKAFVNGDFKTVKLSDYKDKWVVVFFYPADFTFVCPTELGEMADTYEELKKMNVEVLSVSTDTEFTHMAWHQSSETIKKIKFPMLADPTGVISRLFGVYIQEEGLALRGTFIISPEGLLKTIEINNNDIGRNAQELVRKIQAAEYVHQHGGEVCPASWKPGGKTLKPGKDLVGKI